MFRVCTCTYYGQKITPVLQALYRVINKMWVVTINICYYCVVFHSERCRLTDENFEYLKV